MVSTNKPNKHKDMKTIKLNHIDSNALIALLPLLPEAATNQHEFRILKEGGKRARYESVGDILKAQIEEDFFTLVDGPGTVEIGERKGKEFVALVFTGAPKEVKEKPVKLEKVPSPAKAPSARKAKEKAKTTKEAKAPAAKKDKPAKKAKEDKPPRVATGFLALVRKLNSEVVTSGKEKGHSKHDINAVADAVLKRWPEKEVRSVKRIAYNTARNTGIKWKTIAPENTGYMNRIDELLAAGEMTTRQIGEAVSVEFEKDLISAKTVVRARLRIMREMGHAWNPPLEDQDSRLITYLEVE